MNQGIIKVSQEFWGDKYIRNALLKYIKVIKIEHDLLVMGYIIRCASKYFKKEVMEAEILPQYEITFKVEKRKSILGFERKDRIVLDNCSLYGE